MEMHECIFSTVATDALVVKYQAISIHSADYILILVEQFYGEILEKYGTVVWGLTYPSFLWNISTPILGCFLLRHTEPLMSDFNTTFLTSTKDRWIAYISIKFFIEHMLYNK